MSEGVDESFWDTLDPLVELPALADADATVSRPHAVTLRPNYGVIGVRCRVGRIRAVMTNMDRVLGEIGLFVQPARYTYDMDDIATGICHVAALIPRSGESAAICALSEFFGTPRFRAALNKTRLLYVGSPGRGGLYGQAPPCRKRG